MKLLLLANHYNTLRIFRRELIRELARHHEVVVAIPPCDEDNRRLLASYGARVVFIEMSRRGMNPLQDVRLLRDYLRLLKQERPDKVVCYTVKCNIYGALACRYLGIEHHVNVTGLGTPLERGGFAGFLVSRLYRLALKRAKTVFCENPGDGQRLVAGRMARQEQLQVMPGAGVNLDEFAVAEYPESESPVRFLFIGRIMQEKGVDELFAAIERLHHDGVAFVFDFIGWYEEQYEAQVKELEARGLIRFHGFQDDVRPFIRACHCSVLPSWHEGMSNTLLESASMARPLITTDVHGCCEAVEDGVSGFLVPLRDATALHAALKRFCDLPHDQRCAMGLRGRQRMEQRFDKRHVVARTCQALALT